MLQQLLRPTLLLSLATLAACSAEPIEQAEPPELATAALPAAPTTPCTGVVCGRGGSCDEDYGVCVCHDGYYGPDCDRCDSGYEDNDGDGVCVWKCELNDCGRGTCDPESNRCVCQDGYIGQACDLCALGYKRRPANSKCEFGGGGPFTCVKQGRSSHGFSVRKVIHGGDSKDRHGKKRARANASPY